MERTVRACDRCGRYDGPVFRFEVEVEQTVVGDVDETRVVVVDWCDVHTADAVKRLLNTLPLLTKHRWIEDVRHG